MVVEAMWLLEAQPAGGDRRRDAGGRVSAQLCGGWTVAVLPSPLMDVFACVLRFFSI